MASHSDPSWSVFKWPPISHDVVAMNVSGKLIRFEMLLSVMATSSHALALLVVSTVSTS